MMEKQGFLCEKCGSGDLVKTAGGHKCNKCGHVMGFKEDLFDKTAGLIDDTPKE